MWFGLAVVMGMKCRRSVVRSTSLASSLVESPWTVMEEHREGGLKLHLGNQEVGMEVSMANH